MLAALLCNLEQQPAAGVGPILRKRSFASVSRDVERAARQIQELLAPSLIPGEVKAKIKRSTQRIAEISELTAVLPSVIGGALIATQSAIIASERLFTELQPQPWMIELRLILDQLTLITVSLNDDEEALLLLM